MFKIKISNPKRLPPIPRVVVIVFKSPNGKIYLSPRLEYGGNLIGSYIILVPLNTVNVCYH